MRMVEQENNGCVYASLAMVLNEPLQTICHNFKTWELQDSHPFPAPWDGCPRVPSMHEICDEAIKHFKTAFVPFEFDPEVAPHPDCPPIKVWTPTRSNPHRTASVVFNNQLRRGPGLIEGMKGDKGHMVAWDGSVVYDPRGYCYSINVAGRFDFSPRRFWLSVKM